jgi:hypothetical protein
LSLFEKCLRQVGPQEAGATSYEVATQDQSSAVVAGGPVQPATWPPPLGRSRARGPCLEPRLTDDGAGTSGNAVGRDVPACPQASGFIDASAAQPRFERPPITEFLTPLLQACRRSGVPRLRWSRNALARTLAQARSPCSIPVRKNPSARGFVWLQPVAGLCQVLNGPASNVEHHGASSSPFRRYRGSCLSSSSLMNAT